MNRLYKIFVLIASFIAFNHTQAFSQLDSENITFLQRVDITKTEFSSAAPFADTTNIDVEIQAGTSQNFSQGLGSCFGATSFSDSSALPAFIDFKTTEVTISGFGSVRAKFTLSVSSTAPDTTFLGTITYTIFRGGVCFQETILLNITVTPPLVPVADFTVTRQTIIAGGSASFTDLSINAITDWQWDFGDGESSTLQNPQHIYTAAGSYTVSLTVTGPAGNDSETKNNYITVAPMGTAGQQIWAFETAGGVFSSPAIGSDGTIYVGSSGDKFYAINPDGTEKWSLNNDNGIYYPPALGSDETIYYAVGTVLRAVSPDGVFKWTFGTGGTTSAPAIGIDGTIYVGSVDGKLYAIRSDGTQKWAFEISCCVNAPSIGSDGTIYFGSGDAGDLYAINPDGTLKWVYQTQLGFSFSSAPAIGLDGTIFIGTYGGAGKFYAVNPNGTQKFVSSFYVDVYAPPIIAETMNIYLSGSFPGSGLWVLNSDGTVKWNLEIPAQLSSPTIGSDGMIYVSAGNDTLYAFKPDGTIDWTFNFIGSSSSNSVRSAPTISPDGTLYVGHGDNYLYAVSGHSPGLAQSPWPRGRQNNRNTGRNSKAPPVLLSPANGANDLDNNLTFTWQVVAGASMYEFQLDKEEDFSSTLKIQDELSENSLQVTDLEEGVMYYWRVRATTFETVTDWSAVNSFSTFILAPEAPTLVAPTNEAVNLSTEPVFIWNSSDRASAYRLQLSNDPTFQSTLVDTDGLTDTTFIASQLDSGKVYFWRVSASNTGGTSEWSSIFSFSTDFPVSVLSTTMTIPKEFVLKQNYPNPFNPETLIEYHLPKHSKVMITVYSLVGQEVITLVKQEQPAGIHSVTWNGKDVNGQNVASGVYFYQIRAGNFERSRKLLLLR